MEWVTGNRFHNILVQCLYNFMLHFLKAILITGVMFESEYQVPVIGNM